MSLFSIRGELVETFIKFMLIIILPVCFLGHWLVIVFTIINNGRRLCSSTKITCPISVISIILRLNSIAEVENVPHES